MSSLAPNAPKKRYAGDASRSRRGTGLLFVSGERQCAVDFREPRAQAAAPFHGLPRAYDLAIHVRGSGGKRLWPVLLTWVGGAVAVFGALWLVLRLLAADVPAGPGS